MSFLVAVNIISIGFLVALTTHSMKLFEALKCDFQREFCDVKISQTKLFKPLSVHEYTHQMQTYYERKEKLWGGTFKVQYVPKSPRGT